MSFFKFIDFHTHPFLSEDNNICKHIESANMSVSRTKEIYEKLGKTKICGSVLSKSLLDKPDTKWEDVQKLNDLALELEKTYNGFYIPGFHVHPKFIKESIAEIERLSKMGKKLIGELEPYRFSWGELNYASKEFYEILEAAEHYKMVVSFHTKIDDEVAQNQIDQMISRFKNLTFVGGHLGPNWIILRHLKRFSLNDNFLVDVSEQGLTRHGTLRRVIDVGGKERVLFGSNFPASHPGMWAGAVQLDQDITDDEKEYVFYKNAERILGVSLD
ncbi:MAG: amidohydrolase [Clostridia bacterium]|nr:amidohydrolase [Clostridia bacterium]